ncbi:MAG: AmmeMemoRadiSam system protein B [Victivallales bacterium]|nr:AmmeMemoRadiSam system protein B [Victivallales bacterium]
MNIRRPYAAGSFYPGTAEALKKTVQAYLEGAEIPPDLPSGDIVALMAPHAGYLYSAAVAAPAYKLLPQADCDTIVIIGHDLGPHPGIIAVMDDHDAFDTPLGSVPVDTELVHALEAHDNRFIVHNRIHSQEHSVEIHLPFIKTLKPDVKIVPMLFTDATPSNCRALATALKKLAGDRRILIFASTDLSHYPTYSFAKEIDKKTIDVIKSVNIEQMCKRAHTTEQEYVCDWDSFERACQKEEVTGVSAGIPNLVQVNHIPICSAGGVGTAMAWCEFFGPAEVTILRRANSGDVPGADHKRVVGYASAAFFRK